jgi:DNA-binding response OmpR family regulator
MSEHTVSSSADKHVPIKTILVVEGDDTLGPFLAQAISQETAHQAMLVPDGFQALKAVRSLKPHIFVIDAQLPSMDGIELYDQLRASPTLDQVPVIIMGDKLPKQELQQHNIISIQKPIELDKLLKAIQQSLG